MSAWERSRHIPWSKIQQGGSADDVDAQKERTFREIQREAAAEEKAARERLSSAVGVVGEDAAADAKSANGRRSLLSTKVPYSTSDLFKQVAFGGCIGTITGSVFGFMDGMKSAGESDVLRKASNAAKGRFLLQGTTRSGMVFGAFFGGFHAVKYVVKVLFNPGEYSQIGIAGAISLGALVAKPSTRPSLPYAGMLVGMDAFNVFMRDNKGSFGR